jgi:chromatin remodeling complex protein RSC6
MATPSKPASSRKSNTLLKQTVVPSTHLAAIIGPEAIPRTEATKKIWEYIKCHNLQDVTNRRNINADDKLRPLFGDKEQVSMFELTKLVSNHLTKSPE